jgi:hypothetical protein
MKRGIPYGSLESDSLVKLVKLGVDSDVLRARMQHAAADTFRRYVKPIAEMDRVRPNYLPTQSTGRWSVTEPPLINFPDAAKAEKKGLPNLQACFEPDIGTYWLCSDWNAMHAVFMSCMANDELDISAFRNKHDIHTLTACQVFKLPMVPSPLEAEIHKGESCADWRRLVNWSGKGDRRRHLMKTTRYALLNAYHYDRYGRLSAAGVLEAKDIEEQGLTPDELLKAGLAFLKAKPSMVAFKDAFARDAIAKQEARSLYGRRRKLFGSDEREKFKTAVSHFLQGTEVDVMEMTLLEVLDKFPEARLAWPSHDGLKFVFPTSIPVEATYPVVKEIVERPRQIGKHLIPLYATWEVIREGGAHLSLG